MEALTSLFGDLSANPRPLRRFTRAAKIGRPPLCGLLRSTRMPWNKPLYSQFAEPNGLGGWLAGRLMLYQASNRARARWAISLLNLKPADRVLDIGIGPGYSTRLIADRIERGLVVGVDRSMLMISSARRRLVRYLSERRVTLVCADVIDLPRFDVTFDKVIAVNTFQFLDQPVEVLKLLRARMSPGGTIAIAVQPDSRRKQTLTTQKFAAQIASALEAAGFHHTEPHFNGSLGSVPCVCVVGRS